MISAPFNQICPVAASYNGISPDAIGKLFNLSGLLALLVPRAPLAFEIIADFKGSIRTPQGRLYWHGPRKIIILRSFESQSGSHLETVTDLATELDSPFGSCP